MKIADKARDRADDGMLKWAAKARAQFLPRWMELSGTTRPEDIDYSNPVIHVEFMLCDVRNLILIRKGKNRDKFLAKLSDAEKDVYLNCVGDDGRKYTELENPKVLKAITHGLKGAR